MLWRWLRFVYFNWELLLPLWPKLNLERHQGVRNGKKKQSKYWTMRCPRKVTSSWQLTTHRKQQKKEKKIACNSPSIFLFLGPGNAVKSETESVRDNNFIHSRPSSPHRKRARVEQALIPSPGNCLCCGMRGALFGDDHTLPSRNGISGLGNISFYEVSREKHSSHMWYTLYLNSGPEGHWLISLHTQLCLAF